MYFQNFFRPNSGNPSSPTHRRPLHCPQPQQHQWLPLISLPPNPSNIYWFIKKKPDMDLVEEREGKERKIRREKEEGRGAWLSNKEKRREGSCGGREVGRGGGGWDICFGLKILSLRMLKISFFKKI
ncbi:hypothetical protein GBA52_008154 [Prunus armeniaca]|nr:hypothetical protein GBA52_008154 [Prunus armeniaca]